MPNGQRDGKEEGRKLVLSVFDTRAALLTAVDEYLSDFSSPAALAYGPIEDWDVSQIKGFGNLFSSFRNPLAASFNADLSNWDVSSATKMESMFAGATVFTGNLCDWGSRIGESTTVTDMFVGTSCPSPEDPDGTVGLPMGPFCATCGLSASPSAGPTATPNLLPSTGINCSGCHSFDPPDSWCGVFCTR
jgi:surface protein